MAGRKSVQPNLGDTLKSRNHSLDHLFSCKTVIIEDKKKNSECDSDSDEEDVVNKSYVERVGVSNV